MPRLLAQRIRLISSLGIMPVIVLPGIIKASQYIAKCRHTPAQEWHGS
jgi:hypothetical protein